MAAEYNDNVDERIIASAWDHERPHTGNSMRHIRNGFIVRFSKAVPPKMAILLWEKRLFQTGSVRETINTNRNLCWWNARVERSPKKSLRK
jgi:hypothetical protein